MEKLKWLAFAFCLGMSLNAGHIASEVLFNEMFSCGWG